MQTVLSTLGSHASNAASSFGTSGRISTLQHSGQLTNGTFPRFAFLSIDLLISLCEGYFSLTFRHSVVISFIHSSPRRLHRHTVRFHSRLMIWFGCSSDHWPIGRSAAFCSLVIEMDLAIALESPISHKSCVGDFVTKFLICEEPKLLSIPFVFDSIYMFLKS